MLHYCVYRQLQDFKRGRSEYIDLSTHIQCGLLTYEARQKLNEKIEKSKDEIIKSQGKESTHDSALEDVIDTANQYKLSLVMPLVDARTQVYFA